MSIAGLAGLLGLVLCADASASLIDKYHSDQVLPIAVDSATYRSEIYIDAMNMGALTQSYRVTYYGGADTNAPGPMDCGERIIGTHAVKLSLRELCPALPAGSQYGMLSISTVGMVSGYQIPRLRVFARIQNYQGIGFSVEGIPPLAAWNEAQVIGLKNGVDANGVRHQANCFMGVWPENSVQPVSQAPISARVSLSQLGVSRGTAYFQPMRNGLTRVLDVFAAANRGAAYLENITATFSAYSDDPVSYFAFCTQQENQNFSADFRLAGPEMNTASTQSQVITEEGEFTPSFTLIGSEVARFRPVGWGSDSLACWVSNDDMWIRVDGYYDAESPPMDSQTGRIRHLGGLPGVTVNPVKVGLKPGVGTATGYALCRSGRQFQTLIRMQ